MGPALSATDWIHYLVLLAPVSSEDVLKTALKLLPGRVDSVQYACLTMAKVDFRGEVRHGGAGCWQHCVC